MYDTIIYIDNKLILGRIGSLNIKSTPSYAYGITGTVAIQTFMNQEINLKFITEYNGDMLHQVGEYMQKGIYYNISFITEKFGGILGGCLIENYIIHPTSNEIEIEITAQLYEIF